MLRAFLRISPRIFISGVSLALAIFSTLVGLTTAHAQDRAFQFGLVGDTGYTAEGVEGFKRLLPVLNAADLAFVVHVGDFENDGSAYSRNPSGSLMPCTDESFQAVYDFAKVRRMFFPEGRSLGQRTLPVITQASDAQHSKFRENLRWSMAGVMFVTLHIVGSNDNSGRTPEMDAEHRERVDANLVWMRKAFAEAKRDKSRGLAILTQANPYFENYWPQSSKDQYLRFVRGARAPEKQEPTGYDEYVKALAAELESFDRPVVFLHGDTHRYRLDQPLFSLKNNRRFENFTRVETFGNPDTHWVRVTVDPADPQVFSFKGEIIGENVRSRR